MTIQQDNPRYANPSAGNDVDAYPVTKNPLSTGKKDVAPGEPHEWGSLRNGVPKSDVAFGLPEQANPRANYDPNGNDSGFSKGRGPGNDVMAKPL